MISALVHPRTSAGSPPRGRIRRTVVVAMILFGPCAARAQSTSIDSLRAELSAPDWPTRSAAVRAIRSMSLPLPSILIQPIVALVKQEATTPAADASEDHGEYVMDLVLSAVSTGDKSTIPALIALGGIGISGRSAAFIASGGPSILLTLDAQPGAKAGDAGLVLQVAAFMYAQQGALLSAADSAALMARFLAAASSTSFESRLALTQLVLRIPLPELMPLLNVIAATDTFQVTPGNFLLRREAQVSVDALSALWRSFTPQTLVTALTREQTAACLGASGALHGHCQAMSADLADVANHLRQGNSNPAQQGIKNFRKALQQAGGAGLPAAVVSLLDANAAQLAALVGSQGASAAR